MFKVVMVLTRKLLSLTLAHSNLRVDGLFKTIMD